MQSLLVDIAKYMLLVLKTTGFQLLTLFGPLLFLAVIINYFSRKNQALGIYVFGEKLYIYGFAVLGTAVHELGHALFAIIFGHKINEIKLFSPDSDGTLGYVNHSYNPKNYYHRIGNFFIGIGPIIFGSIVMYIFVYAILGSRIDNLLNTSFDISKLNSIETAKDAFVEFFVHIWVAIEPIYKIIMSYGWYSIILIYILYSIVSSISLSSPDIAGSKDGFFFFVGILLVVNFATIWLTSLSTSIILFFSEMMSGIYIMLILGIVLNIVFVVLLNILRIIKSILF